MNEIERSTSLIPLRFYGCSVLFLPLKSMVLLCYFGPCFSSAGVRSQITDTQLSSFRPAKSSGNAHQDFWIFPFANLVSYKQRIDRENTTAYILSRKLPIIIADTHMAKHVSHSRWPCEIYPAHICLVTRYWWHNSAFLLSLQLSPTPTSTFYMPFSCDDNDHPPPQTENQSLMYL
jgi:hypothetical protein